MKNVQDGIVHSSVSSSQWIWPEVVTTGHNIDEAFAYLFCIGSCSMSRII